MPVRKVEAWVARELASYGDVCINADVVRHAHRRVAFIFGRDPEDVHASDRFGKDLTPSFVADLKANELDRIYSDVEDMAALLRDRKLFHAVGNVEEFTTALFALFRANMTRYERLTQAWSKDADICG